MTGSERSGFEASTGNLYDDARIWLSSDTGVDDGLEPAAPVGYSSSAGTLADMRIVFDDDSDETS